MRPFVAIDWGTSSFRLWSLSAGGEVLGRSEGPFGMATMEPADYPRVLDEQMAGLGLGADVPVVICGMAGAAQGWCEAPYMSVDEGLASLGRRAVRVPDIARRVHILPGVMQRDPGNVMRGEETQLLGLLAADPDFAGTACLPGTHAKWVRVSDGRIERFTTCMTGELFALLSNSSVLRHSMGEGGWDQPAFVSALNQAVFTPASVADGLFSLRADTLLAGQSSGTARARLSGLLIGLELAATEAFRDGGTVTLVGATALCETYAQALGERCIAAERLDAEQLTLRGLVAAFAHIEEAADGA